MVALNYWTFLFVHKRSKFLLFVPFAKAASASTGSAGTAPSILLVLAAASREKPAVITSRAGYHGLTLQSTRQRLKTACGSQ